MTNPNKTRTASQIVARAAFGLWLVSMLLPNYRDVWGWECHLFSLLYLWIFIFNDTSGLIFYTNIFILPFMLFLASGKHSQQTKSLILSLLAWIWLLTACSLFPVFFIFQGNIYHDLLKEIQIGGWLWLTSLLLLHIAAICKLLEPVPDLPDTQPQHD